MDLIERATAAREGNDRLILECLSTGAGPLSVAELAARTGLAASTTRDRARALVAAGKATRAGDRGPLALTSAGRAEIGRDAVPVVAGGLAEVQALLPTEELRAMLRLLVAGIIARRRLPVPADTVWPSFIAQGPRGTGKTVLGRLVNRHLGLDGLDVHAPASNRGDLFGRHESGARGVRFVPSPYLGRPLLVLDELDKASADVTSAAQQLLQGRPVLPVDDRPVPIAATVYVSANWEAGHLFGKKWAHIAGRAVILHTAELAGADFTRATAALRHSTVAVCPLDDYRPRVEQLPAADEKWMRDTLHSWLTPHGWDHTRVETLHLIAVGATALMPPEWPPGEAADAAMLLTIADYLRVSATLPGFVRDGWHEGFAELFAKVEEWAAGEGVQLGPLPTVEQITRDREAADRARRKAAEVAVRTSTAQQIAADEFAQRRAYLAAAIKARAEEINGNRTRGWAADHRAAAAGITERLRRIYEAARSVKTDAELAAIMERLRQPIADSDALIAEAAPAPATEAGMVIEGEAAPAPVPAQRAIGAGRRTMTARQVVEKKIRTEVRDRPGPPVCPVALLDLNRKVPTESPWCLGDPGWTISWPDDPSVEGEFRCCQGHAETIYLDAGQHGFPLPTIRPYRPPAP